MKDVNHCISKAVVKFATEFDVSVIGFEDLTGIIDRTNNKLRKNRNILTTVGLFTNYKISLSIRQRVQES